MSYKIQYFNKKSLINAFLLNKKAVSISILLLVISALVISVIALTYFYTKNNDIRRVIRVSNKIDEIYVKESLLNFYLQDIFDKAVKGFDFSSGKQGFVDSFKKELNNYKDENGSYPIEELKQVESIGEEDVELLEEKLVLKLNLEIKNSYVEESYEGGMFVYKYEKEFQKVFK